MPRMKRPALLCLLLLGVLPLAGAQALGFGANGAVGPTFLGGDPAAITQRILASTQYRLTPGDTYQVSITMNGVVSYPLVLTDVYELDVPYLGTLKVKGMYFSDLRRMVVERLKKVLPLADFISFTLAAPARFDVSVFGGVEAPGIVTVTALSRVSDAIAAARGFRRGASYRQIAIVRGETRITVDLQRYSIEAASELNPTLEPGDRIYVPAQELVVTLAGQVRFPGPYEMLAGETVRQLLAYAGWSLPDAEAGAVELVRFEAGGTTAMRMLDLEADGGTLLQNGDRVRVKSIAENRQSILVTGALFGAPVALDKPVQIPLVPIAVNFPYTPGTTLLSVLEALGGPTPYARASAGLIVRKRTGDRVPVDIEELWEARDRSADIPLEPGDTVNVPIANEVFVAGEVRTPGRIPYNASLTVADYLLAAGGIDPIKADPNGIYFMDKLGRRTRTSLSAAAEPGALLFVDKNGWTKTTVVLGNVSLVAGVITAVFTATSYMLSVIRALQ